METEGSLFKIVALLAELVGYVGVVFICVGGVRALNQYFRSLASGIYTMRQVRITLGTYILVGMEFMVGQDVIETVLYTDLVHIKSLVMTVIIRTVLEFFLGKEIKHLSHESQNEEHGEETLRETNHARPLIRNMRLAVVATMLVGLVTIGASHVFQRANADELGADSALAEDAEGADADREADRRARGEEVTDGDEEYGETEAAPGARTRAMAKSDRDRRQHREARGQLGAHRLATNPGKPGTDLGRQHPEDRVLATMKAAAGYVRRRIDNRGRVSIRTSFDGRAMSTRPNIAVQSGAIYSLAREYETSYNPQTARVILRAAAYLKERHLRPLSGGRALYISETVDRSDNPPQMKLENTAMGLIALVKAHGIDQDVVSMEALRELGRFVLLMQGRDGQFRSHYHRHVAKSARYPGQAILALVLLYRVDEDPKWLEAAMQGMGHLVRTRKRTRDPWSLVAFAELLHQDHHVHRLPVPRSAVLGHLKAVVDDIMAAAEKRRDEANICTKQPPVTAANIAGLVAVHAAAHPERQLLAELADAIHHGVDWFINCQVRNGPTQGGFVPNLSGGATSVKTDDVNHALSALAAYAQMHHLVTTSPGEARRN